MVLLLAVRPLIKALKGDKPAAGKKGAKTSAVEEALANAPMPALPLAAGAPPIVNISSAAAAAMGQDQGGPAMVNNHAADQLNRHVGLAQQIVTEKPDSAVIALRQMLQPPAEKEDA
jgi:flagellar M-ring protein FliF